MNFIERVKDGANRAKGKAQSVVEVSKINGQIAEIEKEMDIHFLKMGKVFYEGYCSEDVRIAEKEMVSLSKTCDGLRADIDELRGRIADLKNERLCKCGKVVALNVNFCPHCGTKMSEDQPKQQQEKEVYGEKKTIYPEPTNILIPEMPLYEDEQEVLVEEEAPQDLERERRQIEELERERERQLELDRRIRYWKDNNHSEANGLDDEEDAEGAAKETFKCQICAADLTLGSKWCPRCGAEQI